MWQWLHNLSPAQATVVGSVVGSVIGFVLGSVTLVVGALINAQLNRSRDDRLRREEQRGVATALRAELAGRRQVLLDHADKMDKDRQPDFFVTPDLAHLIRIMPQMISKFSLLDGETIDKVANAYLVVEQHGDELLLQHGGRLHKWAGEEQPAGETRVTGSSRRLITVSADKAPQLIKLKNQHAETIQEAIARLDEFLRGIG